jgi:8-oxo-dGTP diphosphatase
MAYDHEQIVVDSIEHLKKKIVNSNVLKSLFPSDFSLPELQNVYEQLLNKDLDRRNFRKKFINLGLIEDTGYKNESNAGRPAKLYRFKEEIKVKDLF